VPGQPDGSIGLSLGYGRTRSGRAGNGAGFDVYPLRTAANPYFATGRDGRKLGEKFRWRPCSITSRWKAASRSTPARSTSTCRTPFLGKQSETAPKGLTILPQTFKYKGYAWGMAIDLTACVGMQRLRGGLPGGKQYRGGR
jgi:hypothetical protein